MSFADDAHRAYQDFQSRTPFKQYLELPYQIRMKLSGKILSRYEGKPYILDIRGGIIVQVHTGDYLGWNEVQDPFWLQAHPEAWETY